MTSTLRNILLGSIAAITASLLTAPDAAALPDSYYARSSRLANGRRWVKVKVTEAGIHRITHEQLRQWGFSDPGKVRVFGFPGTELYDDVFTTSMPDDVPEQYSEHIGGALFFYGEGDLRVRLRPGHTDDVVTRRNHYSTYSCYFLSDTDTGNSTALLPLNDYSTTVSDHLSIDYHEPEEFQPGEAGTFWFARPLYSSDDKRVITFSATDYTGSATITYLPAVSSSVSYTVAPSIDTKVMTRVRSIYNPVMTGDYDPTYLIFNPLPAPGTITVNLKGGNSAFPVTFSGSGNSMVNWISFDYAAMIYRRRNRLADHAQLTMNFADLDAAAAVTLKEATAETKVWNVTEPMNIKPLATGVDAQEGRVSVTPGVSGTATLVAFNPGAETFPQPELVEVVDGTTATLHASDPRVDMLIITAPALKEAARRLADIHRDHQGLKVTVTEQTAIFNEFSSGSPSAIALRRYVKMLHDRGKGALKYILLLGQGTADHRFITVNDDGTYVFTYQVTEDRDTGYSSLSNFTTSNFSSDNYFAFLSDDYSLGSILRSEALAGVGRIPAGSLSQANEVIDKIENYLDNYLTEDFSTRAIVLADGGDNNSHLLMGEDCAGIVRDKRGAMTCDKIYHALFRSADKTNLTAWRQRLDEAVARGAGFFGYSGHASDGGFATAFQLNSISSMRFTNNPIAFFATCASIYIDKPLLNMGRELLMNPTGMVAVVGSGRTAYLNRNKALYDAFTSSYFGAAEDECLGDVWRRAFNTVISGFDQSYAINSMTYNLAGDPALPLTRYTHSARLTAVNGYNVTSQVNVKALEPLKLAGTVTDASGNVAGDFNGRAVITLYDGSRTVTTPQYDTDTPVDVVVDSRVLARCGTEVKNGRWEVSLVPPVGEVGGSVNRLTVWATDGNRRTALGDSRDLHIGDPSSPTASTTDEDGPVISEMWIDSPEFAEGDAIGADFTFHAAILPDESGLKLADNAIGGRLTVALDGSGASAIHSNAVKCRPDGSVTVDCPFSNVTDGHHSITLSVADNAGNTSRRSIDFTVVNNSLEGVLSIDDPIVTGSAAITLSIPASARVTRLMVNDAAGNTVETHTSASWPWIWNPAASLPDGHYTITARFTDGRRYGSTPPLPVTLLRH